MIFYGRYAHKARHLQYRGIKRALIYIHQQLLYCHFSFVPLYAYLIVMIALAAYHYLYIPAPWAH